jgi:hypothetical protein
VSVNRPTSRSPDQRARAGTGRNPANQHDQPVSALLLFAARPE